MRKAKSEPTAKAIEAVIKECVKDSGECAAVSVPGNNLNDLSANIIHWEDLSKDLDKEVNPEAKGVMAVANKVTCTSSPNNLTGEYMVYEWKDSNVSCPIRLISQEDECLSYKFANRKARTAVTCDGNVFHVQESSGEDDLAKDITDYDNKLEIGYGENTCNNNLEAREAQDNERMLALLQEKIDGLIAAHPHKSEDMKRLGTLLLNNLEAFGDKQCVTRLSKLDPMEVKVKPNVTPVRQAPRDLGPEKKNGMRQKLQELMGMQMIAPEPNAYWSSAAMVVRKPNGSWRLVIDMRAVNERVEELVNVLPTPEMQVTWRPAKVACYGMYDCLSGFDLLPVDKNSELYFGISTVFGCFRHRGFSQGFTNTPTFFQERLMRQVLGGIDGIFGHATLGALQWIDDSILYGVTFDQFLEATEISLKKYY